MLELLNKAEICIKKMDLLKEEIDKLGVEIKKFTTIRNLNVNLTSEQMYYNNSDFTNDLLLKKIDIIISNEKIIEDLKEAVNNSALKNYISAVLGAYIEDFYSKWKKRKNYLHDGFIEKLISNIKKILEGHGLTTDNLIDEFFKISKDVINYNKENSEKEWAFSLCTDWVFYIIFFINGYEEAARNFDNKIAKDVKIALEKMKTIIAEGGYIPKSVIRELESKCGSIAFVFNMEPEYNALIEAIKEHNSSIVPKKEKIPEKNIITPSKKTEKSNQNSINVISRKERMDLYETKKRKYHPYIDNDGTLTSDEIEYVSAYVEVVLDKSHETKFNVDSIIDDIPKEEFHNEILMYNEIISRLRLNNINSNTNKVLIRLNSLLKENISKKMSRKKVN